MLRLIDRHNRSDHRGLVSSMHRDRKRLFVDIFGWDLPYENGEERDAFDDSEAEYLVFGDAEDRHIASLRFLKTDRPHLLGSCFPHLCEGPIPGGPGVREITRLCLPLRRRCRIEARNILARAIIDYAALRRVRSYTAVCHQGFLSELLSSGWRCKPLGLPQKCGGGLAGAIEIHMDDDASERLAPAWRCAGAAPRLSILQAGLAA